MREGIGVALSGGGHRASLFGLGALLYLADAGKNHQVRSIASVSGGSLTNGVIAQSVDFRAVQASEFERNLRPFARQLAQSGTFMDAPLTLRYRNVLVATFVLAAGPAWLLPIPRWIRLLITLGLVLLWTVVVVSPLFGTLLAKAYGVLLGSSLYLAAVPLWLVPLAAFVRFLLVFAALMLWVSLVFGLRGRVCAHAFRTILFSPGGSVTRLSQMKGELDQVICATEFQSGEQFYFSRSFIYGYRFGRGDPGDLPLHTAVQASACLPGAFPPRWLPTGGQGFAYQSAECPKDADRLPRIPAHLVLTDGGVYDNMADQWAQGFSDRVRCWPALKNEHYEPEELIVVNAWPVLRCDRCGGRGSRPSASSQRCGRTKTCCTTRPLLSVVRVSSAGSIGPSCREGGCAERWCTSPKPLSTCRRPLSTGTIGRTGRSVRAKPCGRWRRPRRRGRSGRRSPGWTPPSARFLTGWGPKCPLVCSTTPTCWQ